MKLQGTRRSGKGNDGVALLISIFVLLLICVVGLALLISSGTESALAGNYRSATAVYYAALAGLEEGRGRLLAKNPNYFNNSVAGFIPPPGTPLGVSEVRYIINPAGSETVAPWDVGNPNTYPDTEYFTEFGVNPPTTPPPINSVSTVAGIQGPLFKWVRINAVTEKSLNTDVDNDSTRDPTTPLYYDGAHLNASSNGMPVVEITAMAILPNGSQKILQYLVAPNSVTMPPFPAAVTLVGNNVDYTGPDSTSWFVKGNDTIDLGSCTHGTDVYALGYSNNGDNSYNQIHSGTFTAHPSNYTGQGGSTPNLGYIGPAIPANLQTVSGLNSLVQSITANADLVLNGPADKNDMPSGMSSSNLMTVVVNGDLDLTNWHATGYGLLLVTGNLNYDPDASWNGMVLLIGKGTMTGSKGGSGQFVGGMFVAQTVGTPWMGTGLPNSADNNIEFAPGMGGTGIYYSSCWIKAATPTGNYKVLSFHEINQ
jgi:hypothetical protein